MSVLHRILQPLATAVLASVLIVVALFMRPDTGVEKVARHMHEPGLLAVSDRQSQVYMTQQPYDATLDHILITVFVGGLTLILVGSLYLIWHRVKTHPGTHRPRHRSVA